MSFALTKWYFDVVTDDGDYAIAYSGEVRWGRLRPHFSAVQVGSHALGPTPWRTSAHDVGPPCCDASGIRWNAAPLDVLIEGQRATPPITHELLATSQGRVTWSAALPRAAMRVHVGDRVLQGLGYVERLDLTLLPWRILADTIRWGRFVAADASLVWIEWQGDVPVNVVFQGGVPIDGATIADDAVTCPDGTTLSMTDSRLITDDRVSGLLAPLAMLQAIMSPIGKLHQTRWLSRGTLQRPGMPPSVGWVIHEVVEWR